MRRFTQFGIITTLVLVAFSFGSAWAQNVNTLVINPSATGAAPAVAATGSDSNISIQLTPKGTGSVLIGSGTPTCADSLSTANSCQIDAGNDGAMRGHARLGIASNGSNGVTIVVTFGSTKTTAPACIGQWDGNGTYGYYIYAVTPTTTGATLKLGGAGLSAGAGARPTWSPGDAFSLVCPGTS